MFQAMLSGAAAAQNRSFIPAHEVVHTGDNALADVYGAKAAGIHGILINSNNISITSLLN
jgi:putative hydrolase of the HAD superfamily